MPCVDTCGQHDFMVVSMIPVCVISERIVQNESHLPEPSSLQDGEVSSA